MDLTSSSEWFLPAQALVPVFSFRQTRLSFAVASSNNPTPPKIIPTSTLTFLPMPPPTPSPPLANTHLSPQAASSSWGLNLGICWVVYRLVNSIYVLDVTFADHDNLINVFEFIHIVNQAVSVIVTVCRNINVTPEKLSRKC